MTLVQITNYTSPNCADRPQVNIHCIENLFTVHDFWATCACPEKTKLPWNFSLYWIYFLHSGFLSNFVLALKTEFPLKIFTVLNIFFTIQDFWATLCLPWKTELPWNFSLHWIYFLHSGVLSNLHALSLKSSGCPEFIALIKYFFYHSGFLSNLRFPCKTELPWNFSLYWNIFYHSGFLSNLRLLWKSELPRNISAVWNTLFTFRNFEQFACACPEKKSCPDIFHSIWTCIFYHSGFLNN